VVIEGYPASMVPDNGTLSRPLLSQRPRNLSRQVPSRPRTYLTDAPAASETLPPVSGTPMSPEGLPVPPEMYYDEGGEAVMPGDGPYGDPCCAPCPSGCCGGWGGVGGCVWVPLRFFL